MPREHGGVCPPLAHGLTKHGDDGVPLALLSEAPELIDEHAQRAVAHLTNVAAENFIRHARCRGGAEVLGAHVVAVRGARFGRVGKLDVLPVVQLLHDAGLQPGKCAAVAGKVHWQVCERVGVALTAHAAGDESGKQVGDFLALQHGVVVIGQAAQAGEYRGQRRHAAQLARALYFVDVQHLGGRDAQQLAGINRAVAGVLAVHPIRYALASTV